MESRRKPSSLPVMLETRAAARPQAIADRIARGAAPPLPEWAATLFEPAPPSGLGTGNTELRKARAGELLLTTVVVHEAVSLSAAEFRAATAAAYHELLDAVGPDSSPVRLWNYIPGILAPLGSHPHRYMAFNAGRHDAYERRYGSRKSFPEMLATATGIGHGGADLVIHAIAAARPGIAIENPRQVPAYLYSRRYGPLPPCFARATLLARPGQDTRYWVLVGGTSSVFGEDSAHHGDLASQARETLHNLEALLGRSLEIAPRIAGAAPSGSKAPSGSREGAPTLARFRHLRVYFPSRVDHAEVAAMVEPRFPQLDSLEYVVADLCRPELMIEIEGVAEV
jgi:chorismate lyase / 3-hydroxybenzoate synthase